MKSKVKKLRVILSLLYDSIFASLIVCFLEVLFIKEAPDLFLIPVCVALFLLSYIFRELAPGNLSMILSHGVLLGLIYVLPFALNIRVLLTGVGGYLIVSACFYIKRGYKAAPIIDLPWPSFLIAIFIYLCSIWVKDDVLKLLAYVIPIGMLILYYFITYLEGIASYLDATNDVSGIPLKKIIQSNSTLVFAIIAILLGGLLLGRLLIRYDIANEVGRFVLKVIYQVVYAVMYVYFYFLRLLKIDSVSYQMPEVTAFSAAGNGEGFSLLNSLIYLAFLLFTGWFLLKLLRRLVRFLLKKRQPKTDQVETLLPGRIDTVKKEKKQGRGKEPMTLNHRLRRLYKQKILRYKNRDLLGADKSCHDIERLVELSSGENVHALTQLYARCRYGADETTTEDVKQMKKLCKRNGEKDEK